MSTIEITVLASIIGCILAIAGFAGGRITSAHKSGREWGEVMSDIKHIKARVDNIAITSNAALEREANERKKADERLHARIDEHISKHHSA